MARHAAPTSRRRALLRAGLTVTAAGAALGLGGMPVAVASATDSDLQLAEAGAASGQALTGALTHSTTGALAPITKLRLNPLSGTGVDPLDNAVGTQIADFKPLSTAALTDPLTKGGGALQDLPLAGPALKLLLPAPSA
ncbi:MULTISPECIES: hypothetical protein [unclassified Streptomyces]|uniref:hypothetical protein n=1 Tax=unclassified Streptomyces TaxID=2593676 RepID=UPI00081D5A18|nr:MULTISPECIES: hypothetical protein [unclassified Streptomyces]MYZ34384.1 hypothetical protein [Streptomyces sp. SID4917]SCF67013.1 hypothetical protein GA0115259_100867 [Streptomyces sp. MnatMP-M17]